MARYKMPIATRTDLRNTITSMRAFGMTEGEVINEVTLVLRGLHYPDSEEF